MTLPVVMLDYKGMNEGCHDLILFLCKLTLPLREILRAQTLPETNTTHVDPSNQSETGQSDNTYAAREIDAAHALTDLFNNMHIDKSTQTVINIVLDVSTQTKLMNTLDNGTQTELCTVNVDAMIHEITTLRKRVFGISYIEGNDQATCYYTGLPTWSMFLHLYMFLSADVLPSYGLTREEEMLAVLCRLRLGLSIQDLARRLDVSVGKMSTIFQKWIDVMFRRLKFLIIWPRREVLQQNMPLAFQQAFPNCRVIIDCSEIFIETPSNFSTRAITYSNYKKNTTVKFLIGITPCGTISFLSKCWGGRISDKMITQKSDFFNFLEPGDQVLADRGFTISDDITCYGASLVIPAFTKGKQQLSQKDVELSKQISKVRIHVERIIGTLKKRYKILSGPLSVSMLKHKNDKEFANIDKLLVVCSSLTNLGKSVISGCL